MTCNLFAILAQRFGFEMSPPPFLALQNEGIDQQILKGVNFASGGSGILNQTGLIWVRTTYIYLHMRAYSLASLSG